MKPEKGTTRIDGLILMLVASAAPGSALVAGCVTQA
jgi:outer membrane murein-binding lipoprotein Lpp